jgi:predicted transcriptional regulator
VFWKLIGDNVQQDSERSRLVLDILNSVERNSEQSQRHRASEFDVALGLVNAYLKYCIKKGYVKVKRYPARRYSYLLTPKGFKEKSRLTIRHLSNSLSFFRQARTDCALVFSEAAQRGWSRVALHGVSEVAEISTICGLELGIAIVAVVEPGSQGGQFMGAPLLASLEAAVSHDGVVITSIKTAAAAYADAAATVGAERVLVPSLLGVGPRARMEAAQ